MSTVKATLERTIGFGVPVIICPRCGWWQESEKNPERVETAYLDSHACPLCKGSIDAVPVRQ